MRFAPALLALTMLVPLAACTPAAPDPEPSPPGRAWGQPTLTFETEEEALAAAMEVYEAYVEAGESVLNAGGAEVERLSRLTTPSWFSEIEPSYDEATNSGNHTEGNSTIIDARIQTWSERNVSIYACRDYSQVRVIDSGGEDVTPPDRPHFATFQVEFVTAGETLLVDGDDLWSRGERCF